MLCLSPLILILLHLLRVDNRCQMHHIDKVLVVNLVQPVHFHAHLRVLAAHEAFGHVLPLAVAGYLGVVEDALEDDVGSR